MPATPRQHKQRPSGETESFRPSGREEDAPTPDRRRGPCVPGTPGKSGPHLLPSDMLLPLPYGAHPLGKGVLFTLVSRHADRVWLLLFDDPRAGQPDREIELDPDAHRIGDIWHVYVPDARPGQGYVYRIDGPKKPREGLVYDPEQWLLDPCALAVAGHAKWGDASAWRAGEHPRNGPRFPRGIIVADCFDWQGDRPPRIPLEHMVVYETHLRSYTAHHSSDVAAPGTYRGFIDKIPYLLDLGITSVELLPIQEFNEMEFLLEGTARRNLVNLWGYSTQGFFAPNGRYALAGVGGGQVGEFKSLVRALHRAGIEVILDVVFNHTAEAGEEGPVYSFRGIDNPIYYLLEPGSSRCLNFTGCGNTMNCNHPVVRDFIITCLRYWALHMHVDGFRFDLASILARGPDGKVLADPPAIDRIAQDPALRETKLIAEAWDAGGAYHLGRFSGARWSEWNERFAADVRRFWRGDPIGLRPLANRLAGSPDLYDRPGWSPLKGINYIASHDGFTLRDTVSYSRKHNRANQEGNRDGSDANHSDDCGVEGPTDHPEINARRLRRQKNMLLTLLAARGIPMLLAGDEFGRTQQGNNNAYCQDNEVSWVDWTLRETFSGLHAFVKKAIALRAEHPALRLPSFHKEDSVRWFGPRGGEPDWEHGQAAGILLNPPSATPLCLLVNASPQDVRFDLPEKSPAWYLLLHTHESPPPIQTAPPRIALPAQSSALLADKPSTNGK